MSHRHQDYEQEHRPTEPGVVAPTNRYDNMPGYIRSVWNVYQSLAATRSPTPKGTLLARLVANYARQMARDYDVDISNVPRVARPNLIPVFEYVAANNIALIDFATVRLDDVDVSSPADIERFVLSHIYYLTQQQQQQR